jgi:hypothetical protein
MEIYMCIIMLLTTVPVPTDSVFFLTLGGVFPQHFSASNGNDCKTGTATETCLRYYHLKWWASPSFFLYIYKKCTCSKNWCLSIKISIESGGNVASMNPIFRVLIVNIVVITTLYIWYCTSMYILYTTLR